MSHDTPNYAAMKPCERLGVVLDVKNVSQAELARRLGVSPSTVNHWLTDRNKLGLDDCKAIGKATDVNEVWLGFGVGPMDASAEPESPPVIVPPPERISTPPPQPPARAQPPKRRKAA